MQRCMDYGLIVLFSAIWSSAFIAGKIALAELDAFTVLALRFLLSAVLILPLYIRTQGLSLGQSPMRVGIQLGILNNAIYLGLTFEALRFIRPELVVVIVSATPFLTTILAAIRSLEPLNLCKVIGMATGFGGVLFMTGVSSLAASDLIGFGLTLIGTAAFSVAIVYFQGSAAGLSLMQLTFWQSLAGAVVLTPVALLSSHMWRLPSWPTVMAIIYLSVFVTVGGTVLWLFLIRKNGATVASAYHLLNPFIAVLLSHFILKTPIRHQDLVGAGAITVGLLVAVTGKNGQDGNGYFTNHGNRLWLVHFSQNKQTKRTMTDVRRRAPQPTARPRPRL